MPPCFQVFRNALNSCSAHYFTLFSSFNRYWIDVGIAHWQGFISIDSFRLIHFFNLLCFDIEAFCFECSGNL